MRKEIILVWYLYFFIGDFFLVIVVLYLILVWLVVGVLVDFDVKKILNLFVCLEIDVEDFNMVFWLGRNEVLDWDNFFFGDVVMVEIEICWYLN